MTQVEYRPPHWFFVEIPASISSDVDLDKPIENAKVFLLNKLSAISLDYYHELIDILVDSHKFKYLTVFVGGSVPKYLKLGGSYVYAATRSFVKEGNINQCDVELVLDKHNNQVVGVRGCLELVIEKNK